MSECKHERITCVGRLNIWRCDDCGHEEPNVDELQARAEKAEQERDELERQLQAAACPWHELSMGCEQEPDCNKSTSVAVDCWREYWRRQAGEGNRNA